jgi:hypothetical protein
MAKNPKTYKELLDKQALPVAMLLERICLASLYNSIKNHTVFACQKMKFQFFWTQNGSLGLGCENRYILNLIAKRRAEKKGLVASKMKQHMKKCGSLQKKMSKSLVPGVVQLNVTEPFFAFYVKLKTMYETFLSDDKFKIWGPMLLEHIIDGIIWSDLSSGRRKTCSHQNDIVWTLFDPLSTTFIHF